MLYEYFTRQKLVTLLKYEDRNAMRFSVEARTPFADHLDLVQYVFNIPATYKIRGGWSKYLLREAMTGILPEAIRLRTDKKGFFIPDVEWMTQLKQPLLEYVGPELSEFLDIALIKKHLAGGMEHASHEMLRTMWSIISFAVWRKVFKM